MAGAESIPAFCSEWIFKKLAMPVLNDQHTDKASRVSESTLKIPCSPEATGYSVLLRSIIVSWTAC